MNCSICYKDLMIRRIQWGTGHGGAWLVCNECWDKMKKTNIFKLMKEMEVMEE